MIEPAENSSYKALRAIIARQNMIIRKQDDALSVVRGHLLTAATALKFFGHHEQAAKCMDAWRKGIPK